MDRAEFSILMKTDPGAEKSRTMPVSIILILSIVLFSALLAAGCDEPPDNHIVIVKLTPNATVEWTEMLDSGGGDLAYRMIQTPDDNIAIFCSLKNFKGLVKLSRSTGKMLWKTSLSEQGCGSILTTGRNGDIISAGGPNICRINSDGVVVWNRTTQLDGSALSILETSDGGYIVGGIKTDFYVPQTIYVSREGTVYENVTPELSEREKRQNGIPVTHIILARFDSRGNVVWDTVLVSAVASNRIITIDLENEQGYVIQTENQVIRLDEQGTLISTKNIDSIPGSDTGSPSEPNLKHYGSLSEQNLQYFVYPTDFIFYNPLGDAVVKQSLKKISVVSGTDEGGYIAAGFPGDNSLSRIFHSRAREGNLHVIKIRGDGSREWDEPVYGVTVNTVDQIIQTSDGGYALMCANDKRWDYLSK
jgi:hypothetical protein